MILPNCASATTPDVPILLFSREHRQAYLQTNDINWPSHWLPAMGVVARTLLPYPGSGYSSVFAAYIQVLRESHLVLQEPEICWADVGIDDGQSMVDSAGDVPAETYFTYEYICLRLPGHIGLQYDYETKPGFSLLDGMLFSSTSLEVIER